MSSESLHAFLLHAVILPRYHSFINNYDICFEPVKEVTPVDDNDRASGCLGGEDVTKRKYDPDMI